MSKYKLSAADEYPLNVVSYAGVEAMRTGSTTFETAFDLVELSAEQEPMYRCRYTIGDQSNPKWAMLVVLADDRAMELALFTGEAALRSHHEQYGDGRALSFHSDGTVEMI